MNCIIEGNLSVFAFREEGVSFIYCPALNLTGYGNNTKEAQSSFKTVLYEYLKYTIENKTLADDLTAHGWKNNKQPSPFAILSKDKELKRVINKGISIKLASIKIPAMA